MLKTNNRIDDSESKLRRCLRHIALGGFDDSDWKFIESRSSTLHSVTDQHIHIFPTNKEADEENKLRLAHCGTDICRFDANHDSVSSQSLPFDMLGNLDPTVFLCRNARVVLTRNICTKMGLSNGVFGTVVDITYSITLNRRRDYLHLCWLSFLPILDPHF